MDWQRPENNIYDKIIAWFEKIGKALQDLALLPENVYNMDTISVILNMLRCVKALVGKNPIQNYRGARVKWTIMTAIECISGDGRHLDSIIIGPASTHRADWITYHTFGWNYACSDSGYTDFKISLK
jgi:hypothetical protein